MASGFGGSAMHYIVEYFVSDDGLRTFTKNSLWVLIGADIPHGDTVTSLGDGLDAPDGQVWALESEGYLPDDVSWVKLADEQALTEANEAIPALLDALIPAEMLTPLTAAQKLESLGLTTDDLRELLE
jgi:hypothetical protein